jgi:hypothetical protein
MVNFPGTEEKRVWLVCDLQLRNARLSIRKIKCFCISLYLILNRLYLFLQLNISRYVPSTIARMGTLRAEQVCKEPSLPLLQAKPTATIH